MTRHRAERLPAKGSLELIEEAVHLVRRAPLGALAGYYVGTLPFVLGGLYFWTDMSRSPFAAQHLAGTALGLAGLFLWMKLWQAVFAGHLRALAAAQPLPALSFSGVWRTFVSQSAWQPTGLILLPLASLPLLPLPWTYAFYQNLSALGTTTTDETDTPGRLARKAMRQATLWPTQNHALLLLMCGFGLFVFVNWATVGFILPGLVRSLLGIESIFTRSGVSLLNSTFFAIMFGLTYLCLDPILKAVYVLRCFYGESVESGEDLKAEFRQVAGVKAQVAVCITMTLGVLAGQHGMAAEQSGDASEARFPEAPLSTTVSPPALDHTIQEVIQERKYTWRMPREKVRPEETSNQGVIGRFLQRAGKWIGERLQAFGRWLGEWLRKLMWRNRPIHHGSSGYGWMGMLYLLIYVLLAAVVVGVALLLFRLWRERQADATPLAAEPIATASDLADESLGADQLPEDGWSRLARELLERGELRLALRAFYFSNLAYLAGRNLVSLAKFKSNRDYERELQRRGHAFPVLLALFGENVSVFDRIWYGLHEINRELVNRFVENTARIRESQ
jgi:uncharacterized membrane protein